MGCTSAPNVRWSFHMHRDMLTVGGQVFGDQCIRCRVTPVADEIFLSGLTEGAGAFSQAALSALLLTFYIVMCR